MISNPPRNTMPNAGHSSGFSLGDMKQQLITLLLFRSTTGGGGGGGNSGSGDIYTMIWTMIMVSVVEKVFQHLPEIIETYKRKMEEYTKEKVKQLNIVSETSAATKENKKETSRITIKIETDKSDNPVGDAILDYITNAPNIEKAVYLNKTYLLNNNKPILIDAENDIYVKLHNELKMDDTADNENKTQIISLYSHVLDIYELRKIVEKLTYEYSLKIQNKLGDDIYLFDAIQTAPFMDADNRIDYSRMPGTISFIMKKFITNRKFKNVIGPQARQIKSRVEFFKNNKKWYDDKGIPYTLGLLLSGPPGGGKTSTIKCVANEMRRHIINVKLTDCITKTQMENLFFNENITVVVNGRNETYKIPLDKRLYVFEDVDCQNSDIVLDRELISNEISVEEIKGEDDATGGYTNVLFNDTPVSATSRNKPSKMPEKKSEFAPWSDLSSVSNYQNYQSILRENVFSPEEKEKQKQAKEKLKGVFSMYEKTNNKTQPQKKADNETLEKRVPSEKLSLSCLLNIFDGILETPGRIIIMTSNYPKKLDRALIRPGRIDLICEFTKCNHDMIVELFEAFYDVSLSDEERMAITSTQEYQYTPAELTKIMFENFDDYKGAIKKL